MIITTSVVLTLLGATLFWGVIDLFSEAVSLALDATQLGGFLMAFGIFGILAGSAARSVADGG